MSLRFIEEIIDGVPYPVRFALWGTFVHPIVLLVYNGFTHIAVSMVQGPFVGQTMNGFRGQCLTDTNKGNDAV